MLYACPIQYALLYPAKSSMRPHYAAQLSGTWANHLPFLLINQVSAVLPWHTSGISID